MDIQTLKTIKNNFLVDLRQAVSGKQTSLPFIRHHLSKATLLQSGDIFQAVVVGGSICQRALMKKVGNQFQIIKHSQKHQEPLLTKTDLMILLEKNIYPEAEVVAINFAYPLTPVLRKGVSDGVLQSGTKDNPLSGLVGMQIGEEVEMYMRRVHDRTVRVVIANDIVCLLLSGLISHTWDAIAAGVVGTGLNFGIFLDTDTIVNLESANFTHFPPSEAGEEVDRLSQLPGSALYEKEVSGAYLYQHFNILAQKRGILFPPISSSEELSTLTHHETSTVARLAQEVLDHSASLVAAQIAGIVEFAHRDLHFVMQGSLYWKGNNYKERVTQMVNLLVPEYRVSYEQVLYSDFMGAAKLVA